MTKFLVDSWAWVEYLEGGKAGRKVKEEVDDESNEIFHPCCIDRGKNVQGIKYRIAEKAAVSLSYEEDPANSSRFERVRRGHRGRN